MSTPFTGSLSCTHAFPSLAECLRESFARHASLIALEGRSQRLTFAELDARSAALARQLAAVGVNAGDIVPLVMRRSLAIVVAEIALIRLGAAYAPVDLASPALRQHAMLQQLHAGVLLADIGAAVPATSGCRVVRVDPERTEFIFGNDAETTAADGANSPPAIPDIAILDTAILDRAAGAAADPAADPVAGRQPWAVQPPDAPAYVMFTSGTTGTPKGVLIPQSGIVRLAWQPDYVSVPEGSRWAFLSSPAFDASTLETWAPLLNGGCCVVQEVALPTIDELADFLRTHTVGNAWLTSALFSALVDDRVDALCGLQQLLAGGERVSPQHARRALEMCPGLKLINGYGPTENTTFTLTHDITIADTHNSNGIPIGTPIRGTSIRISSYSEDAAHGELLAGGDGVAIGYLHDAELTARKFIQVAGARWYRTGDLVQRDGAGAIEYLGRVDRQVKLQGHRIELDEVERTLQSYPGISMAAVRVRGESAEARSLVGYYHGTGAVPPAPEVVLQWLRERLMPAAVPGMLHPLHHVPLNSSGKIDYSALDANVDARAGSRVDAPADEDMDADVAAHAAAPENASRSARRESPRQLSETERMLADIWQQFLPEGKLHADSDFLQIGGNSLLALQVSAQVRRQFGRELSPIDVLRTPQLDLQAQLVENAAPSPIPAPPGGGSSALLPLTQIQNAVLASSQLDDSGSAFLVHVALHFEDSPDIEPLQRAFRALAARHPSLRLCIDVADDPLHGIVASGLPAGWWRTHDTLPEAPVDASAWSDALLSTINRRLELSRDGVMRVDFWPVANGSSLLVWTIHHVVMDEASIDRCLVELHQLLSHAALPAVYGTPSSFCTFERATTDREAVREWSELLLSELRGLTPPLPRAPARGAEFAVEIPESVSNTFLEWCNRQAITPFAPLLLAYGRALQLEFGEHFRFVSTPFSRRMEAELLEPVGCLLDVRIIDAGVRTNEPLADALRRVQSTAQSLQRSSFLSHALLSDMISRRDPMVARHLDMFGFTWRLAPAREVTLGASRARLIRVRQQGARFGVTLHTWLQDGALRCSIEAVNAAVESGRASAVGRAFVQQLAQLSEIDAPVTALQNAGAISAGAATGNADRPAAVAGAAGAGTESVLRTSWAAFTKVDASAIAPDSHFLSHGGNSLAAMRLAAQLRREHGIVIDVGAFLAHPTFAALTGLAQRRSVAKSPPHSAALGVPDAPQVVMLFPGNLGTPLGTYRLGDALQQQLGERYNVVIIDLEILLMQAPQDDSMPFVFEQISQLVRQMGGERIVAAGGLSSGGLFALQLSEMLQEHHDVPVWLVDTYAPMGSAQLWVHRVVRPVLRRLVEYPVVARALRTHVRAPLQQPADVPTPMDSQRARAHQQLYRHWHAHHVREVHLVQARKTVREVSLLWRRSSNGFRTGQFADWRAHPLDGHHAEMSGALAPTVAKIIADGVRAHVLKRSGTKGS